jgi:lysophospholipase L1-like esterase
MRLRLSVPFVALLLAVPLALSSPAAATPSPPIPQPVNAGFDYLALGDSVAFGYRPSGMVPTPNYADPTSFVGYPEDLAAQRGLVLANASCAGETSGSLLDENAQSNGCENSVGSPYGYRDFYPLHVDYSGSQLQYALDYLAAHPRTRLVTLDIGANDTFICQKVPPAGCEGAELGQTLAGINHNVSALFAALRGQAHYRHDIVLLSYYSLSYSDPLQVAGTLALNQALTSAAEKYGVIVADGFGAFAKASASAGGDPCAAGLVIPLPGGGCDVHPTAAGHEVLTAAIEAALAHGGR